MLDIEALAAIIDALTPHERDLLTPLMLLDFPITVEEARRTLGSDAFLMRCITTGLLQYRPVIHASTQPGVLYTTEPGIFHTLAAWSAWNLWHSRKEDGIYHLPEWLDR